MRKGYQIKRIRTQTIQTKRNRLWHKTLKLSIKITQYINKNQRYLKFPNYLLKIINQSFKIIKRYGLLYYNYENRWFTIRRIAIKILQAIIAVLFHANNQLKGLLISAIIILQLIINIIDKPFKSIKTNKIIIHSLFA